MTVTPLASRTTSPRCDAGRRSRARSAIASSGTSNSSATAVAASTFGEVAAADERRRRDRSRRAASTTRALVPSIPRSTTRRRAHVGVAIDRRTSRRGRQTRAARAAMRSSSALATSSVAGVAPSRISAFASAIASTDAKKPRCASPTFVHTRTSGSAMRDQRADFPGVIHPELDDRDLRPLPQLDQRQRQPDVVVEVPAVAHHAIPRREQLRRHFLRRGLAGAAGDRHDLRARLAPHGARQRLQRRRRVVDLDRPTTCRRFAVQRARRGRAATTTPAAPRVDRRLREVRAVEALAADRDEQLARPPASACRSTRPRTRASRRRRPTAPSPAPSPRRPTSAVSRISGAPATARRLHDARVRPPPRQRLARHRDVVERQRLRRRSPGTSRAPCRR